MQNGGWTVEWQGRFTPDIAILDKDNNNTVQKSELSSFMKSIYDKKFDEGAVDNWMKDVDKNSNGQVDEQEMLAFSLFDCKFLFNFLFISLERISGGIFIRSPIVTNVIC